MKMTLLLTFFLWIPSMGHAICLIPPCLEDPIRLNEETPALSYEQLNGFAAQKVEEELSEAYSVSVVDFDFSPPSDFSTISRESNDQRVFLLLSGRARTESGEELRLFCDITFWAKLEDQNSAIHYDCKVRKPQAIADEEMASCSERIRQQTSGESFDDRIRDVLMYRDLRLLFPRCSWTQIRQISFFFVEPND